MIDQKTTNPPDIKRHPITPQRIALIRVWNDLLLVVLSFIFLNPILDNPAARIILGSAAGMFIGSMLGYFLIRQGRQLIGMGFVIYGLLFGLTTISIFVDGLGPFALVTMVLVTTLSVSYAIPVRRAIEAISASLVLGIFSLVFDLYWRSSEFGSLVAPPQLPFDSLTVIVSLISNPQSRSTEGEFRHWIYEMILHCILSRYSSHFEAESTQNPFLHPCMHLI